MKVFDVIRIAVGALFLWSGLSKAQHPYEFLGAVYGYRLVGPWPGVLIAAWLPWLEMGVGCCLLGGLLVDGSFVLVTLLSGAFALAVTSAWWRGLAIHCGCIAGGQDTIGGPLVARSFVLLLVCATGLSARATRGRRIAWNRKVGAALRSLKRRSARAVSPLVQSRGNAAVGSCSRQNPGLHHACANR